MDVYTLHKKCIWIITVLDLAQMKPMFLDHFHSPTKYTYIFAQRLQPTISWQAGDDSQANVRCATIDTHVCVSLCVFVFFSETHITHTRTQHIHFLPTIVPVVCSHCGNNVRRSFDSTVRLDKPRNVWLRNCWIVADCEAREHNRPSVDVVELSSSQKKTKITWHKPLCISFFTFSSAYELDCPKLSTHKKERQQKNTHRGLLETKNSTRRTPQHNTHTLSRRQRYTKSLSGCCCCCSGCRVSAQLVTTTEGTGTDAESGFRKVSESQSSTHTHQVLLHDDTQTAHHTQSTTQIVWNNPSKPPPSSPSSTPSSSAHASLILTHSHTTTAKIRWKRKKIAWYAAITNHFPIVNHRPNEAHPFFCFVPVKSLRCLCPTNKNIM